MCRRYRVQIFSDLNRTVHKTSKSLDILYDHRLPINQISKDSPVFGGDVPCRGQVA